MSDPIDPRQQRYGLGRLHAPDDRDTGFLMRAVLSAEPAPTRTRAWRTGPVLNQGATSSCTGQAAEAWLMGEPIRTATGPDAYTIYAEAQKRDPWKDIPHEGSTVRAAVQYLQEQGHVGSYVWAWDLVTVQEWLLTRGTVIMGTNWYRSMFRPDPTTYVLPVGGALVGGHAWHLVWYNQKRGLFKLQNSWGTGWGDKGFAYLTGEDLERLIREDGEAVAAVEARVKRQRK